MIASDIKDKLIEAVVRLRKEFSPIAIYLYGSYAYGTPGPHSDLDLLIIVNDSALNPYARDVIAYKVLGGLGMAKDVQVYTSREFEERASLPVSFEHTVKKNGKLLHVA